MNSNDNFTHECQSCNSKEMKRKRSFLGFEKLICLNCGKYLEYPLSSGYRVTYWILGVWFGLVLLDKIPVLIRALSISSALFMNILAENSMIILVVIGAFMALVKDFRLKKGLPENPESQDTSGWNR